MSFEVDFTWSVETIQPLAIQQIYSSLWPGSQIVEVDKERQNNLAVLLDIAGADKLLRWPDGGVSFLAQRFRRFKHCNHDDFTLRRDRPSGRATEASKVLTALRENRLLAAFYAYGHVNQAEDGFLRFRVFDFVRFLEQWHDGSLLPDGYKANRDGSARFWYWRFPSLPSELFIYNSEPIQMKFF